MDKYGIQIAIVPLDNEAFKTSPVPTSANFNLFGVPNVPNMSVEVVAVGIMWDQIPIDATDAITADLSFHDKSAGTNTAIVTAYSFKSTNTSLVAKEVFTFYNGNQRMDSGDTLSLRFTTTSPDTAGLGGSIMIAYRVKEYNGE